MYEKIIKKEYEELVRHYESAGGDTYALISNDYASLVVNGNRVLSKNSTKGIEISTQKIENGIYAKIRIKRGYHSKNPVHLCFGMLPREGKQVIKTDILAGDESEARFIAHCIFPNAVKVEHIMDAKIIVGKNAKISYEETHFHGKNGGVKVAPKSYVTVKENGEYNSSFILRSGRAGEIKINYEVHLGNYAKGNLNTKIYARGDDRIFARESIRLEGENSRGMVSTRMALRDHARSEIIGETVGMGKRSRGHVECTEIIMDDAIATSSPVISAKDPTAKVTHEAAIGSVDKKQMITLMARGLSEEEAVDVIVGGLLK